MTLEIEDDPVERDRMDQEYEQRKLRGNADDALQGGGKKDEAWKSVRANDITKQLKEMSCEELKERGDEMASLIEQRELEESVFGAHA